MRFNQAFKAPIILEVGDKKFSVPKFTLRDQVEWAAELDSARAAAATNGMTPLDRFHTLNSYDVLPTDVTDLARRARSVQGIERICRTCLTRATLVGGDGKPIGEQQARDIMEVNPEGLGWLAEQLADIHDRSKPPAEPETPPAAEKDEDEDVADPLPQSAKAEA